MEDNQLIKYDNGQLTKVGNAIAVTNKLLALSKKLDATFYFDQGIQKFHLKNYLGSIEDFTKAIEINPQYLFAYTSRGASKERSNDYIGAIEDHTKAIEINPQFEMSYYNRGVAKSKLNDYIGAIEDYTKAIEINPKYTYAYYNRAFSKQKINDTSFCDDWKKAEVLGHKDASDLLKRYCTK